jgi:hypothetical protein
MALTTQQSLQKFHRSSALVTIQMLHPSHPTGSGAVMQTCMGELAEEETKQVGLYQSVAWFQGSYTSFILSGLLQMSNKGHSTWSFRPPPALT